MARSITRLLIANRGEIAVRIARTARRLGIETVGIYADPDRDALHTDAVDIAVALGGSTPAESYLQAARIIERATELGCDAVHPGYGFLAENAEFAQAVIDAGMVWVGPTPDQIRLLGDKIAAKRAAIDAGVPTTPIVEVTAGETPDGLTMPVLVKAAAGGGGRGMRIVRDEADLADAIEAASREARSAFGDGTVFIEPYLERGRHIEVQILGDAHGTVLHFHERDCSVQRRNQKVIEEAPAPDLDADVRAKLHEGAVALARHVGYQNAGTVEFLVGDGGVINFLEVNTRLQVEHPVSEEVTGIDLVREQFRIAEGGLLDPVDPVTHGHSIEFRINGEDPGRNFMPTPGPVHVLRFPGGPGVRVDSGVTTGDVISGSFDSLLAKLIVTGHTRADALERARRALDEFEVAGLPTVLPFHRRIVRDPAFIAADGDFGVYTRWIETEFVNDIEPWGGMLTESGAPEKRHDVVVEVEGKRISVSLPTKLLPSSGSVSAAPAPRRRAGGGSVATATGTTIASPMQATIVKVAVANGDKVVKGDLVLVLEAMKMEQPISAHRDGTIAALDAKVGATVSAGHRLLAIED